MSIVWHKHTLINISLVVLLLRNLKAFKVGAAAFFHREVTFVA